MGFLRFRKSITIVPGVKFNLGKKSASVSVGVKGLKTTIGTSGARATVGIPGTGLSYTQCAGSSRAISSQSNTCPACGHKMRKQWPNCPKCRYVLTAVQPSGHIKYCNCCHQKVYPIKRIRSTSWIKAFLWIFFTGGLALLFYVPYWMMSYSAQYCPICNAKL